ncbi:MAG: type II toxin-antitoxin system RelE/ParE family toxin [Rhodocyclaceae bacterium]|nr:type II toxin-antitoxin system RelE/ParE family toxin [Rhodocyclaceae bacterium]
MSYQINFHPFVARDLDTIAHLIIDYSGPQVAARKLAEIEAVVTSLKDFPHRGSIRNEIVAGLRAIPAGRKAVIAFVVDDNAKEVLIYAISYGGSDWIERTSARGMSDSR